MNCVKIIVTILICFLIFLYIRKLIFNSGGKVKLGIVKFRKLILTNPVKWEYTSRYYDRYFYHLYYNDYLQVKLSFFAFLWFLFYSASEKRIERKERAKRAMAYILEDIKGGKSI